MLKTVLTRLAMAATLSGAMFVAAPVAQAKVSIGIWIGSGYWKGPGYYGGRYRTYVSCREGAWIVDNNGYNWVRPVNCFPRYYEYQALRWGARYIVRVDARWGNIVGARRY